MIEIVILACLAAAPGDCREATLTYSATGLSLLTCVTSGHFEVAGWQNEHPGLQVKRWQCRNTHQSRYTI